MGKTRGERKKEGRKSTLGDLYAHAKGLEEQANGYVRDAGLNPKPKPENADDGYIVKVAAYANFLESELEKSGELEASMEPADLAIMQEAFPVLMKRLESHIQQMPQKEYAELLEKAEKSGRGSHMILTEDVPIFNNDERQMLYYKLVIDAAAEDMAGANAYLNAVTRARSRRQFDPRN